MENQMKSVAKSSTVLLLTALFIAGCASDPAPQKDPYNDADSQRSRAKQSQDEMSRDTSK
jgi:PBP1b-binding outer membrane lipoprotein LpoB